MIAADTNIWIAYFSKKDRQLEYIMDDYIDRAAIYMPPVVLSELLSDPEFPERNIPYLKTAPIMEVLEGYWIRAGRMRAGLILKGFKPKLPDTLIAQSCIDHDVPLLTRDDGFKIFKKHAGLKLV